MILLSSNRARWLLAVAFSLGTFLSSGLAQASFESVVRTVAGEVEAVNVAATPQIIVVKVMLPTKETMIVGATVGPDIPITRGKRRVGLDEIRVGDHVTIQYRKDEAGLTAESLVVRPSTHRKPGGPR